MTRENPLSFDASHPRATAAKTRTKAKTTPPQNIAHELETIYRSITDGVFIYDGAGRVIRMNQAARQLLHLAPDDSGYLTLSARDRIARAQMCHSDGSPMPESDWIITRLLSGETITPQQSVDVQVTRADGSHALISFTGAPLRDDRDAIVGAVSVGRDVTERRLREDELRRTNLQLTAATAALARQANNLEQMNRRMDQFVGMANHEMKSPLTALSANLQLATRRLQRLTHGTGAHEAEAETQADSARLTHEAEAVLGMLARAQSAVRRMTRLVNELLDVSRIQAGKLETHPEPCDLLALTQAVLAERRHAQPARVIALETRCEHTSVIADPDRISEVIDNYLSNATKYSPADTPVTVTLTADQDGMTARLSVRDEGQGILPEAQARIWNVFERLESQSAQSADGVNLGLGLHICKTIIALHSGEVGVESAPGAGSTFWFTLPLALADEGDASTQS
ncbi:MAG TPA: PAS domain-containing sensor histidine kinase [Ktedonobacterales bacterium]|jgi:PAS domain S-box-containing protein|nr:PAS domain-containing sensor histidine kinase [Ktedonobacterales bacterium]